MNTSVIEFSASDYKSWIGAVMAATEMMKTLKTKEEVDELKKQIKDTWSFDGKWENAAPMLNNVANIQLRKIGVEEKSWQLCIDLEFHFHGTEQDAKDKVMSDAAVLEKILQITYCGSGLEYQPTNYTIKLNGEVK